LASAWAAFALWSIFHGLGSGAIDAGLNSYVAHNFSAKHMNWLHACYSLGATLGPLLMTGVLTWVGSWRLGYSTIGTAMLMLSLLFLGTRRRWDDSTEYGAAEPWAEVSMTGALRHSRVWLQILVFFVYTGMEITVGQWSFTLLTESRGIERGQAGIWVSAYWGGIGIGRVLFGFIVERVGIDRLLRWSTLAAISGSLLLALGRLEWLMFTGLVLVGLAFAPIYPCLMTRTPQRLGPGVAVHAIGFQVSAAMVGAAVLPGATGLLAEAWGLEVVGATAVALALLLFLLHEGLLVADKRVQEER
jgi:fucose permease